VRVHEQQNENAASEGEEGFGAQRSFVGGLDGLGRAGLGGKVGVIAGFADRSDEVLRTSDGGMEADTRGIGEEIDESFRDAGGGA
jgi:hypothetical protein